MSFLDVYAPHTRQDFFIQESPREPWHVETRDNCEIMLCGISISIYASAVRVQYRWGPKKCPDCFIAFHQRRQDGG